MHAEDADDHNLPKMTWLGVEPLVGENPEVALEYASRSRIPLLAQFIARRAVDANALDAAGRRHRQCTTNADQLAGGHAGRARGTRRSDGVRVVEPRSISV